LILKRIKLINILLKILGLSHVISIFQWCSRTSD